MGEPRRIKVSEEDEDLGGFGGEVEVVGESHYQDTLETICGGRKKEGEEREVEAVLVLDDGNRYDPLAVGVSMQGKTVGYLSREDAREYRTWLKDIGHAGESVIWDATIRGGWDRGPGDRGHYGVGVYIGREEDKDWSRWGRGG